MIPLKTRMNEFDCFHGKFMKLDVSEKIVAFTENS